jgi:PmbA protein
MPELADLCRRAVEAAPGGTAVEAYASESRRTDIRVRDGEVESLTFASARGVGVRAIADGRVGYAFAADPEGDEIGDLVRAATDSARFSEPDPANVLPEIRPAEPIPGLTRDAVTAVPTDRKVELARSLERAAVAASVDVRRVESARYGDASSRMAVASTSGGPVEMERTDAWAAVVALAERDGETQTGFSFRLERGPDELALEAVAVEAASRAARLLGGTKPASERVPVVLDPVAASSFLGVLSGALSAESVLKGRSLLADMVDDTVASEMVTLVDDGRLIEGPAVAPFDDEAVATGRTVLIDGGTLRRFLHNTYTATRAGARSTGNAGRASYRSAPGVSPSNLFLEPGSVTGEALIAGVERGVYVQDVTGLHSGANPITGQFSVGAAGLRISKGALAEPLREMTIASTLLDVLRSIIGVGADLRFFFGGAGSPTVVVGEMTVAGT